MPEEETDLREFIIKNKKEDKSMFLFSPETVKMVKHTSLGESFCITQNFLS